VEIGERPPLPFAAYSGKFLKRKKRPIARGIRPFRNVARHLRQGTATRAMVDRIHDGSDTRAEEFVD
jgi:hypothetical protein